MNMSVDKRKRRTHDEYVLELRNINPNIEVLDLFINTITEIKHKCKVCEYEWFTTPHRLLRAGRTRCPECAKKLAIEKSKKQNYAVGQIIADDNRNLLITDVRHSIRKNGHKLWEYKYKCNRCGFDCGPHFRAGIAADDYWIIQDSLRQGKGCACCTRHVIVPDINSIAANINNCAWMSKYFKDQNDAKKYPPSYSKKVLLTCPDCGRDKLIAPHTLRDSGFGCVCGDGLPYPEKFMYNILEQLEIDFDYHKAFEWSKNTSNGTKYYDFFIPSKNIIIETNGLQHYKRAFGETITVARTFEQEQTNDLFKKDLALKNGITNYIELDCSRSDCDFIFNSILSSGLLDILNKNPAVVDIANADIFASSNIIKICSDLWNAGVPTEEIANRLRLHKDTVRKYMYKADKFGWCSYKKINNKITKI